MGVTLRDKNSDGKIWLFVEDNGKRWSECLGVLGEDISKRAARQYAREVWEGIILRRITGRPGASPKVADYIERHLEAQAQRIIARTLYTQEIIFKKYVTPQIGHLRLNQVTPDDCRQMVSGWHKALGYQTRLDYHSIVNVLFKKAVTDELIHKNPFPSAHELFGKRPRSLAISKDKIFAPADIVALLKWAYANVSIAHATYLATLALTGMRPGEARALKWDVIDWRNRKIEIKWSFSSRHGLNRSSGF